MVKAATDFEYKGQLFREGSDIPGEIYETLELKNPSLLSDRIEINARWVKITSPTIKGFVESQKNSDLRIKKFLSEPKKMETPKVSEKEFKFSEEQLFLMSKTEQIGILNKLGSSDIPRLEKERVKLILQLQG